MFYYFIESENNPQEDPLLIWLTGGPGCSSLFAILFENGEFIILFYFLFLKALFFSDEVGKINTCLGPLALKFEVFNGSLPSLASTTYSWTKVGSIQYTYTTITIPNDLFIGHFEFWIQMANIIFLDQPVGAGFSYSRTPLLNKVSDTGEINVIHEFLRKVIIYVLDCFCFASICLGALKLNSFYFAFPGSG